MTELELKKKAAEIQTLFRDAAISDEEIIRQIREIPELIHATVPSGANLFLAAVNWNRFAIAMALSEMGADIHWKCDASGIGGNALNVAKTPQEAEKLLEMGLEIERNLERNLRLGGPFLNPAVKTGGRNNKTMMFYWLQKQKELFADEPEYVRELFRVTIDEISMMNQSDMLSLVIADDELYPILKDIYAGEDSKTSIRLHQEALREIDDKSLEPRKKELRKILNTRKKELAAMA